jgi:hypothetical protein
MDSEASDGIGSGISAANTAGSSPDIEMSPVPEGAGLERAPPLDHSIDVPLGSAAQQEDQQSQSSAISRAAIQLYIDPVLVLTTLISRMHAKYSDNFKSMSAEELQQFKRQCSTALDAPALSKILTNLKLSPDEPEHMIEHMIAVNFSFYNYCGPLLLEDRIINPDYFTDLHNYTVHEFTGPINRFVARGHYLGERDGDVPCGFGLWVGVDFTDVNDRLMCTGVTIMGGQWSIAAETGDVAKKDDNRFTGSMLHVCWRAKQNSRSFPESESFKMHRVVGYSYKGTLSYQLFDDTFNTTFDTTSCPDAVFREFEVAVPVTSLSEVPLQLWHELFIDTLSDDGLERNACRNVLEHAKVLGSTSEVTSDVSKLGLLQVSELYRFLTTNYIGGGLQYFVPSIVKGRCL